MAAVSVKSVIENMTTLNVYKKEFDVTIEIYVGLVKQYRLISKAFLDEQCPIEGKTGADTAKKSPIVATLENLRKDILTYSIQLGLTPAGLKRINQKEMQASKKASKLDEALSRIG